MLSRDNVGEKGSPTSNVASSLPNNLGAYGYKKFHCTYCLYG